ncbi:MAG: glycine zipper domain-containing protein [Rhodocyclaceae bacterium]
MPRRSKYLPFALSSLVLAGCATPLPPYVQQAPAPVAVQAPAPTQIYVYPAQGQDAQRTRRDRYECHNWAVGQSRYDPSAMPAPRAAYYQAPPAPSYQDTAVLAITGAAMGAAVANPHNAGTGAVVGAVVGGLLGAASDATRQEEAQRQADLRNAAANRQYSQDSQRADAYRRALSACLEGRGYNIR